MNNVNLSFYRGDTYERVLSITGWNDTIDSVFFTVKNADKDKDYVLQKRLGSGIVLIEETDEYKKYSILIKPEDTDNLKTDYEYPFDIEIISGENKKTIVKGTLILTTDITTPVNEV